MSRLVSSPAERPNPAALRVDDAAFVASAGAAKGLPAPALAEVAFAGRSNVGKSSLLNALVQRRGLVRTSRTPGCTRALNVFSARFGDGLALQLVDLPGYGYAKLSKSETRGFRGMVEGYLLDRPTLRGVVVLCDVRRGLAEEERELLAFLARPPRIERPMAVGTLVVATKLDKLPRAGRKPALAAIAREAGCEVLGTSAETGEGRDALCERLRRWVSS